ncbi:MAG: hypothetical protein LBL71_00500 [Endomicrobium sp.]|jgi:hypothetical protein|nr:hypothetical protein [Endomicrobium sp.]
MSILREAVAVSLALLLALLPVQKVLGEKVLIGVVDDRIKYRNSWKFDLKSMVSSKIMELFKSQKGEEAFNIFLKTARDNGIIKIITPPNPQIS